MIDLNFCHTFQEIGCSTRLPRTMCGRICTWVGYKLLAVGKEFTEFGNLAGHASGFNAAVPTFTLAYAIDSGAKRL